MQQHKQQCVLKLSDISERWEYETLVKALLAHLCNLTYAKLYIIQMDKEKNSSAVHYELDVIGKRKYYESLQSLSHTAHF